MVTQQGDHATRAITSYALAGGIMKVCKFGGTSLASAAQIRKVCQIVLADP